MKLINSLLILIFLIPFQAKAEVTIADVPAISIDYIGILDEKSDRSLGTNLWENSLIMTRKDLISLNPYDYFLSVKSYDLLERMMLSLAQSPKGGNDGEFIKMRMDFLYDLGKFKELVELINSLSPEKITPKMKELKYNALLMSFYYKKGCKELSEDDSNGEYYDRLHVFCSLYSKNYDAALLSMQIMREQKIRGEFFYGMTSAVIEKKHPLEPEKASYLTPVILGLYRLNNYEFKIPLKNDTDIAFLKGIFENTKAVFATRLEAGEKLLKFGAISKERFRHFLIKEQKNKDASKFENVKNYYAVVREKDVNNKVKLLANALQTAKNNNLLKPYALLYAPIIKDIRPNAGIIGYSYYILASLLYANEYDLASDWLKIAERDSEVNEDAKKTAFVYTPIIKAINGSVHYGSSSIALKRFYEIRENLTNSSKIKDELQFILRIYESFGIDPDSQGFMKVNDISFKEADTLSEATINLKNAISDERIGDAFLLGLMAIKSNDDAIVPFLSFLRKLSLKEELEDIAINLLIERLI